MGCPVPAAPNLLKDLRRLAVSYPRPRIRTQLIGIPALVEFQSESEPAPEGVAEFPSGYESVLESPHPLETPLVKEMTADQPTFLEDRPPPPVRRTDSSALRVAVAPDPVRDALMPVVGTPAPETGTLCAAVTLHLACKSVTSEIATGVELGSVNLVEHVRRARRG